MDISYLLGLFGPLELQFATGMALAIVIGYLMGGERELRGKDAGISTHILVIAGAMLFSIVSWQVDPASPSRIAAQVVTGIGFLGAGLILHQHGGVRNLTTAASLWVAAAVGVALGFGLYLVAVIAGVVSALIPRIPRIHYGENHELS